LATAEYALGVEVLDLFERQAVVDPRMPGEPHPALPHLWIFETPAAIARLPRLIVVYTIDEAQGVVDMWNLYQLG